MRSLRSTSNKSYLSALVKLVRISNSEPFICRFPIEGIPELGPHCVGWWSSGRSARNTISSYFIILRRTLHASSCTGVVTVSGMVHYWAKCLLGQGKWQCLGSRSKAIFYPVRVVVVIAILFRTPYILATKYTNIYYVNTLFWHLFCIHISPDKSSYKLGHTFCNRILNSRT